PGVIARPSASSFGTPGVPAPAATPPGDGSVFMPPLVMTMMMGVRVIRRSMVMPMRLGPGLLGRVRPDRRRTRSRVGLVSQPVDVPERDVPLGGDPGAIVELGAEGRRAVAEPAELAPDRPQGGLDLGGPAPQLVAADRV